MTSMTGSVVTILWLCFVSQVQAVIYTLMLLLVLSNQKEKKNNELKFKFFDFLAGVCIESSAALARVGCPSLASNLPLAIQLALALPGTARGGTHSLGGCTVTTSPSFSCFSG